MHSITHLVFGILFVYLFQITGVGAVIFLLATVLIDIDHILEIGSMKRSLSAKQILNPLKFAKESNYVTGQKTLHLFHTFEVIVLLYVFSLFYAPLFFVAHGFMFHLLFDAFGNIWNRNIKSAGTPDWYKYWFVSYFVWRRSVFTPENKPLSVK